MQNVILGTASGYPLTVLDRFCGTARRAGHKGRIVLWTDEATMAHAAQLRRRHDVELLACPAYPYHVQTARYLAYEEFLSQSPTELDRVLLCDVRDVVFRTDPFAHPQALLHPFCAFLEETTIGDSIFNKAWVQQAFGDAAFLAIAHEPVSCSGTTLGTVDAMQLYLAKLNAIAKGLHAKGQPITVGLDQGIHNVLLHRDRFLESERVLSRNQDGLVFTMGYARHERGAKGWPQPVGGAPACMIHQFDRMNCADVKQFGATLGCDVSDLVTRRALIQEGTRLQAWLSIEDGAGVPLARLTETASATLVAQRQDLGDRIVDALSRHHVGDTILLDLPELPPAIRRLGGDVLIPRSAFTNSTQPTVGSLLALRDQAFAVRRLVVTGVDASEVHAQPDLAPRKNGFRLTMKVATAT